MSEAVVLKVENDQDIERRQAHALDERQAEEQIGRDGGAEHFGKIGGGNRDLAGDPEKNRRRPRVVIAIGLREVAAAGDAEADSERLQ